MDQLNFNFVSVELGLLSDLVERGGPVVVILVCLSVVALAVVLLKTGQFLSRSVGSGRGIEKSLQVWLAGDSTGAISSLSRRRSPSARTLHHVMRGIVNGRDKAAIREDAERVALDELALMNRHLRFLEATSQIAPLLGLFGTVIGMMNAFQALQSSGAEADPAALAGGIWIALTTTAVGLAVAIPAGFALYWFESRIAREKSILESSLTSVFTSRLMGPADTDFADQPPTRGVPHAAE